MRNHPNDSGQFVGSAVVVGADYRAKSTVLQLQTFTGMRIHYTVEGVQDPAGAAQIQRDTRRPISVKIQVHTQCCSVTT